MLNSGAALVCCCYVAALGKVLRDGMPSCDAGRFVAFLAAHMADFCKESDAKDADLRVQFTKPTVEYPGPHVQHLPKCSFSGGNHGTAVLYAVFRCGFVHSFADGNAVWCRAGADEEYWVTTDNGLAVNVDRLAKGFLDGLYDFTSKYTKHSDFYPALTRGKGAPDGHYADEA